MEYNFYRLLKTVCQSLITLLYKQEAIFIFHIINFFIHNILVFQGFISITFIFNDK